ncbi:hypothetical protein DK847_01330 [Aestuariivirga litoralis]|uniref:Uncharacterized protein n=1 Tax=Aestuariivirga litoralis TaxID=2650924 RepID=A0A2W2BS11_9HYPH|nr:hypothetical protein [Aestuariivirga litoralis]PZF78487.1 hypothetical protein DK847_01330 [Aestuariivirga litoralis]
MFALRFAGHLAYFKLASTLLLQQGLSNGGVVVATAAFALGCLAASRWIAGLRRVAAEPPHPAALPLLGATAVLIAMMVMGPVISTLLPRHPERALELMPLIPAWFALLAPPCTGFIAAQILTARRPTRT